MWFFGVLVNIIMAVTSARIMFDGENVNYEHDSDDFNDYQEDKVMDCDEARLKCAYRNGCGMALQNYMIGCSTVIQGPGVSVCPEHCQHSLIALTSTEEGQQLMNCRCSDDKCEDIKNRIEICRPQVLRATRNDTIVTCHVAQWICAADGPCTTALGYYNRYCRSMFQGRKCSYRCMNSISILQRQEKAAKLKTCRCDGREDYDCPRIQSNMARLCFNRTTLYPNDNQNEIDTNQISVQNPNGSLTFNLSCLCLFISLFAVCFSNIDFF